MNNKLLTKIVLWGILISNGNTNSGNNKKLHKGDNRLHANSLLVFPPAYPLFFIGDDMKVERTCKECSLFKQKGGENE